VARKEYLASIYLQPKPFIYDGFVLKSEGMKQLLKSKNYFGLIKELALTDFKLKYQNSVLGYLWSLVSPFSYFLVLYLVFTKVFKVGGDIPHYPIYLLLGVMIFSFWNEATAIAMGSIVSRGDLIRKVYFPRIVLVISSTLTSLITFILNMLALVVLALFTGVTFGPSSLLFFLLVLELYVFIMGVSFYLSALFVKFRDIGHIWGVLNQILFYATPIVYPLALVPNKFAKFVVLSPLTQIIQDARRVLIGISVPSTGDYWAFNLWPHLLIAVIFVSGYFLFQRMAAKFAEEV